MVDGLGIEHAVIDQESKNRHIHKRPRQEWICPYMKEDYLLSSSNYA